MEVNTKKICWNLATTRSYHEGIAKASEVIGSASKASYIGGIQRRFVLGTVGAFARLITSVLNRTTVHNLETLLDLVHSRPRGTPLVTVSNHMSTLDDPLMWGVKGLPITDPTLSRWTLAAEDICFTNPVSSYFSVSLHVFPEGKLSQEEEPMRRLKWGTASLIGRASVQPVVLPIAHSGFEKVLPENYMFGRRPIIPLPFKNITIVVGEPMVFDIPQLRLTAEAMIAKGAHDIRSNVANRSSYMVDRSGEESNLLNSSLPRCGSQRKGGLGVEPSDFLEKNALHWMYSHMSEKLRSLLQELAGKAKQLNNANV